MNAPIDRFSTIKHPKPATEHPYKQIENYTPPHASYATSLQTYLKLHDSRSFLNDTLPGQLELHNRPSPSPPPRAQGPYVCFSTPSLSAHKLNILTLNALSLKHKTFPTTTQTTNRHKSLYYSIASSKTIPRRHLSCQHFPISQICAFKVLSTSIHLLVSAPISPLPSLPLLPPVISNRARSKRCGAPRELLRMQQRFLKRAHVSTTAVSWTSRDTPSVIGVFPHHCFPLKVVPVQIPCVVFLTQLELRNLRLCVLLCFLFFLWNFRASQFRWICVSTCLKFALFFLVSKRSSFTALKLLGV